MSTAEALQITNLKEELLKKMSKLRVNFADSLIVEKFKNRMKSIRWLNKSNFIQTTLEKRQTQRVKNDFEVIEGRREKSLIYQLQILLKDFGIEKKK